MPAGNPEAYADPALMAEAKQRLAAQRGRPSDLPAMMQRIQAERGDGRTPAMNVVDGQPGTEQANNGNIVHRGDDGRVYNYNPQHDITTITLPDGRGQASQKGNAIPKNNMDAYLDRVLEMSGMMEGNGLPAQGPIPPDRPDTSGGTAVDAGGGDVAAPATEEPAAEDTSGLPLWQVLLLGGGGAAALAMLRKAMQNGQVTPEAISEAGKAGMVAGPKDAVSQSIDAVDGETGAVVDGEAKQLAAPAKQLEGPKSAIDQSIDNVEGAPAALPAPEDTDQMIQDRVEGRDNTPRPGPNRFAPQADDTQRQAIIDYALQMPPRDAAAYLRENGLDPNSGDILRLLADKSNAMRGTATRAIRQSVR